MQIIRCKIETFSSEHDVNCIDGGRSSDPRVIASLNRKFQEGFKEDEPHEVDILSRVSGRRKWAFVFQMCPDQKADSLGDIAGNAMHTTLRKACQSALVNPTAVLVVPKQVPHVDEKMDTYQREQTAALAEEAKALEAKAKQARETASALARECNNLAKLEEMEKVRAFRAPVSTR
eukprot:1195218-Prorocentrum_minimum.AAC.2